jgi:protein-tyrosine phosphatase
MLFTLRSYIKDIYGSKRGLAVSVKYHLMHRAGYLRELRDVDFSQVRRLVFVCAGNLCRSPIGEYYARHLGLEAESYGLNCRGGDPADPRAIQFGKKIGLNLSDHRTRNICDYTPSAEHLVVAMEPTQAKRLVSIDEMSAQVTIATLWLDRPVLYLHDPFAATSKYFETCGKTVVKTVELLSSRLADCRKT